MKKTVLLVTDFYYEAKGREYFREDLLLGGLLRKQFNVCTTHIDDAAKLLDVVDVVLLRNTGPQSSHKKALAALRSRRGLVLYNDLLGKGDINGKGHLLELFMMGFPVIPTYSSKNEAVGKSDRFLLKPLDGADSCGVQVLSAHELVAADCQNMLIQPLVDFQYEVSFYFVGKEFQYALYAPNPHKRWELETYPATQEDITFAKRFVAWNSCRHGIQRVDACRTKDGQLLLMELEDYNPFLSLELLEESTRQKLVEALCSALEESLCCKQ
ncbi:MAG: hypothetical protein JSR37_02715 [Verrucomicrobia bacterium]|nr:hypothetical protein [Verrucomicrobiota bacterium]MBS0636118.1 hypothetical protein [Verrucomicrobiota bacterium]